MYDVGATVGVGTGAGAGVGGGGAAAGTGDLCATFGAFAVAVCTVSCAPGTCSVDEDGAAVEPVAGEDVEAPA